MVQYPRARDGGGDPVDAGSPGSLVVVAPPGVASVFVEIAGRPASNRRWVLDKLCSWRQSNIETLCQANIGRDSSGLSWSGSASRGLASCELKHPQGRQANHSELRIKPPAPKLPSWERNIMRPDSSAVLALRQSQPRCEAVDARKATYLPSQMNETIHPERVRGTRIASRAQSE